MAKHAIAIEIESSAIKTAHVKVSGSRWEIVDATVRPLGEVERYPEGEHRNNAISKLIMESLPAGASGIPVVIGLSGRSIMLRFVQSPRVNQLRLETLMTFEAESQAIGSKGGLAFDYLPLNIASTGGTQLVALAVAQKKTLDSLSAILEKGSVKDVSFSCGALGLANSVISGMRSEKGKCELIADIGAQNISLVLVRDKKFVFSRTVAGGGSRIVQSVKDAFNVSEKDARDLIEREAKFLTDDRFENASERHQKLHKAISGGLSIISGAIQSTIMFAKSQVGEENLVIDRVLLTGGVSQLQGIEDAFTARLGETVEKLALFDSASKISGHVHCPEAQLSSAIGLALAEAGLGLSMDIRTGEHRESERTRRHDSFAFIGGPILAVTIILAFLAVFFYGNIYGSFSKEFKSAAASEKDISGEFKQRKNQLAMLRESKDYLLEKTSSTTYMLGVIDLVKTTLDAPKNEKRFKDLFFESIYVGDKERVVARERTSRFGSRPGTPECETETDTEAPPEIHLIGWCRSKKGSTAIELARLFAVELLKKEDLIIDFSTRNIEVTEVDEPGWKNQLQIKFEITLKMKR